LRITLKISERWLIIIIKFTIAEAQLIVVITSQFLEHLMVTIKSTITDIQLITVIKVQAQLMVMIKFTIAETD
jgi:hypothetical protein